MFHERFPKQQNAKLLSSSTQHFIFTIVVLSNSIIR